MKSQLVKIKQQNRSNRKHTRGPNDVNVVWARFFVVLALEEPVAAAGVV